MEFFLETTSPGRHNAVAGTWLSTLKAQLSTLVLWATVLLIVVSVSRIMYRLLVSPLHKIPGPKLGAITYLYEFYYQVIKPYQYTIKIDQLHKDFGPIIRVNPNKVHIYDAQFHVSFGQSQSVRKDSWYYNPGLPGATVLSDNSVVHKTQKKRLVTALAKRTKEDFPRVIQLHTNRLALRLMAQCEQDCDMNLLDVVRSLSYDIVMSLFLGDHESLLAKPDFGHLTLRQFRGIFRLSSFVRHFPKLTSFLLFITPRTISRALFPVQNLRLEMAAEVDRLIKKQWETDSPETILRSWTADSGFAD
ncbi:hypothetical protein FKW77_009364 [Venturia effusa]|uniref:Cytochrome P450 monooxygenase n=1 Tax=Venturia effusa TaxID=50376 RepID=A0A517KX99_9PEZI|nr:hypothetical protein FKW77_009364 [Venturia effusa]